MRVKIIQDSKQSTRHAPFVAESWFIQSEAENHSAFSDRVTGWLSSNDTNSQVNIKFSSLESAISFANAHNLEYEVIKALPKKLVKRSYADNFK